MESKNEKKLIEPSGEKLLPVRDEKLLRAPTFFERHSMLRLAAGITILIAIVAAGVFFAPSRFKNDIENDSPNILVTPIIEDDVSRYDIDIAMVSYESPDGKFSIEYPHNYDLDVKNDGKGTIQLSKLDESGGYFKILIEPVKLQGKFTLDQVIKNNPVCDPKRTQDPIDSMINNSIPAKIYTNVDCMAQGKTLIRAVSDTTEGTMMYTFVIDSQFALDEFKSQLDEIMSTFKVIDNPAGMEASVAPSPQEQGDVVFCTMDAMQCPDGSFVGRSGPKCEFVCAGSGSSAPDKPVELNSGM